MCSMGWSICKTCKLKIHCLMLLMCVLSSEFNNNQLASLPIGVFAGLASLENMCLHSCERIHSIDRDFSNNQLTSLPASLFDGVSKLQHLLADESAMLTSLPCAANSFTISWHRCLVMCLLDRPACNTCQHWSCTVSIDWRKFNNNQLTSLPVGVFDGLTSLQYLWAQSVLILFMNLQKFRQQSIVIVATRRVHRIVQSDFSVSSFQFVFLSFSANSTTIN